MSGHRLTTGLLLALFLSSGSNAPHYKPLEMAAPTIADVVRTQISNSRCFSSPEYLYSCRQALRIAREETRPSNITWSDYDFDTAVSLILAASNTRTNLILERMFDAYLSTFDPHAFIMSSDKFDGLLQPGVDTQYGIGIRYIVTDAGIFIRRLLPESPASIAGLKPFDRIYRINGVEVGAWLAGSKNMELLSGAQGDVVTVEVERDHWYQKIPVTIGLVAFPEIEFRVINLDGRQFAYVWLSRIKAGSCRSLRERLDEVRPQVQGLILDLRDNSGGLLDQAMCIAGLFVGRQRVVGVKHIVPKIPIETGYDADLSRRITWTSIRHSDETLAGVPLVVIVNANSASGTELIAGALQDHRRAWLVGERTFGKGSVQTVLPLPGHPDLMIGFTTAFYYRPSGTPTQLVGITPDFEVPIRRSATAAERRFPRERDFHPSSQKLKVAFEWHESRPEIRPLRNCLTKSPLIKRAETLLKQAGSEDYQEAYALSVLACDLGRRG